MIPLRDNIPSRKFPFINYFIIGTNGIVFFYQIQIYTKGTFEAFIYKFGVVPNLLTKNFIDHSYTLITSQFLHGGWVHIIWNLVYLYIFGDNVEDRIGHVKYLFFYLACGCGAALTQFYFNPVSEIPMIGASGAIAGVLGAYFLLYPKSKVIALVPLGLFSRVIEIPSFFFLGFWFIMQTFSGTATLYAARALGSDVGGVAWFAHVGGFIVGASYVLLFLYGRRRR